VFGSRHAPATTRLAVPRIVASLAPWIAARARFVVLDGESSSRSNRAGAALGFQRIQERIHLTGGESVKRLAPSGPRRTWCSTSSVRRRDLRALRSSSGA